MKHNFIIRLRTISNYVQWSEMKNEIRNKNLVISNFVRYKERSIQFDIICKNSYYNYLLDKYEEIIIIN